MITELV